MLMWFKFQEVIKIPFIFKIFYYSFGFTVYKYTCQKLLSALENLGEVQYCTLTVRTFKGMKINLL